METMVTKCPNLAYGKRAEQRRCVEKTLQVYIDHRFPVKHAQFVEPRDRSDTGVADNDIEPAEPGASHLYKSGQIFATLNVHSNISCFTAGLRNARRLSKCSVRRAPRTTFAPRTASRSADTAPIPLLAPVMATTLPFESPGEDLLLGERWGTPVNVQSSASPSC